MLVIINLYRGEVGCTIYSFICLSARTIEECPCIFAIILRFCAPPKVWLVLVLCYRWRFFSALLYRQAFIGFSCCYGGLSYSLHFTLLSLLQHALSQRLGGSWLWAWAYSPRVFDIILGIFESPLLWIGPPVPKPRNNQSINLFLIYQRCMNFSDFVFPKMLIIFCRTCPLKRRRYKF